MDESRRLAEQLTRALDGEAWHGPAWREALDGIGLEAALRRPIPGAHGIAEIVLHVTTWQDTARLRLEGGNPQVTDEQDWPAATFADEAAWQAAVKRLFETGHALAETVARFPSARLEEQRPGDIGTYYALIQGILCHDLYHAGQVGLLRKAAVAVTA
jgi:hypothetical protein